MAGVEQGLGLGSQVTEAEQGGEAQQLRQQLQQRQAQYEAEMERMNEEHAAHVAGIQAQAVAKMKELIEKVNPVAELCTCLVAVSTQTGRAHGWVEGTKQATCRSHQSEACWVAS